MNFGQYNSYSTLKYGIWIDGEFSWLDDASWSTETSNFFNETMQLSVLIEPCTYEGTMVHVISIRNYLSKNREIKLFFNQSPNESSEEGVTFYAPAVSALVRSFGEDYFLMNGQMGNRGIVQYCANFKQPSSIAEGHVLSQPFSSGGTMSSVISLEGEIKANEESVAYLWMCHGTEEQVLTNNSLTQLNISFIKNNKTQVCSK
ncbi:hypothetical protein H1D32_19675 [Anaerobacillus sp. CMMVII]|uniref:hypothetical protein n=1 Tax=Anaerobacillus sp. CMMVII TaxID=2755588 RepID=UPI0021B7C91C|nr:hypothetical protein [Anaerobacillus sp. CMMVII]MCT8139728.1 hypothetical protein [Anaerobacillus sp. CMMVII]